MRRLLSSIGCLAVALCLGCENKPEELPGPPPTGGVAQEEQPAQEREEAHEPAGTSDSAAGGAQTPPEASDTAPSAESEGCPSAREPKGMCAQVITWAKNPDTGTCCEYPTPCHAPKNWKTYSSEGACEK